MSKKSQNKAFVRVIEDHKKLVYKIARSYTKTDEDCRDLIQEITLQLWKAFPKYNSDFKLSTWMYRIALNVAISFYRKEKKRNHINTVPEEALVRVANTDHVDQEKHEKIQQLYGFINQLKELDKAIMILYLEQNSYEEIADVLGITKTNVATKISRIKIKLKSYFLDKSKE